MPTFNHKTAPVSKTDLLLIAIAFASLYSMCGNVVMVPGGQCKTVPEIGCRDRTRGMCARARSLSILPDIYHSVDAHLSTTLRLYGQAGC
ncbi:hypothetical protein CPB85DRAFT_269174 [Mucidula mucida]|nr:hypothetical protein CPB85DRAFT_269174 [Mucidula mucida]